MIRITARDPIQGDEVPSRIGDQMWSGLKSFSDKDESTVRRLSSLLLDRWSEEPSVFDSEFLEYRETDQKYVFSIVTTPLVLKDQDLKVHLMSSKEAKIAAVQLSRIRRENPRDSKKNSYAIYRWTSLGWIIAMITRIFANSP